MAATKSPPASASESDLPLEEQENDAEEVERFGRELKPTSRAELERRRKRQLVGVGPSGAVYRLRQLNVERLALAGGMPGQLISVALEGGDALNQVFKDMADAKKNWDDLSAEDRERYDEVRNYMDNVVIASCVEPAVTKDDLGQADDWSFDALIPPPDYEWIVAVATRQTKVDAEGRALFGTDPIDQMRYFRHWHGCGKDCEGCSAARTYLPSLQSSR